MGTVGTSTLASSSAFGNQRKLDRCANGVQFDLYFAAQNNIVVRRSTDDGSTWASQRDDGYTANYTPNGSIFVGDGDIITYAYKDPTDGYIKLMAGLPTNAARTTYSWSGPGLVLGNTGDNHPDIVTVRNPASPGTWVAHVVSWRSGNGAVWYSQVPISSAGAVGDSSSAVIGSGTTSVSAFPSIDFRHTGDGKTVAGGQPDLFVGWSAGTTGSGAGIRFRKATYSAGSWTWGTEREIDNNRYVDSGRWLNCMFDGTRVVLGGYLLDSGGQTGTLVLHERDAADTTTVSRSLGTLAAGAALNGGSGSYDALGNFYFLGVEGASANGAANSAYRRWVRSTSTLEARVTIDTTTPAFPYFSARRGPSGSAIDYVYTDGTASPYTVTSGRILLNVAPTAATPTTPTTGSSVDRTQAITLAWVFNDPDAGDSQSKSDIRYKLTSASTWTTILGATTVATSYALPANQTAGDYEWQVLTYDAQGVISPWSTSSFFTAASPPTTPTITAPFNGGTVSTASYTVTWSAPQQDAYEVRRVADNAGSPNPSTVYSTTGLVTDATSRARTLAFETNNRTEHVQVRVTYQGITSAWASARVLVSYTPPATPTVVLTPQNDTASMLVTITNPTPSGNQPAVASHDILIDDGLGEGLIRRATGWTPGAAYTYWLARSDWDYAGRITVIAIATNGTTSTGVAT